MITLDVRSSARTQMIDITDEVRRAVASSGVNQGLVCVASPHTTAAVTVQENDDPDVKTDMLAHLARMVPKDPSFRHGEGNSDAHIKTSLVGPSVTIILDARQLVLGRWQAIFFCEFDGPRDRKVHVQVVGT
jgi:secondary thiamine-phosphate synthase enzyme